MNLELINIKNHDCLLYKDENPKSLIIQIIDINEKDALEKEIQLIKEKTNNEFILLAFSINNWNEDLSPWNAPAVFGNNHFGASANTTLEFISNDLLPSLYRDTLSFDSIKVGALPIILAGYSLAGLFSLWSGYNTDIFHSIVAVSPSVWFKNWDTFIKENEIKCNNVYLSLGNKESNTKNIVMKEVANRIEDQYTTLREQGITTILEWNDGNHFTDFEIRMAKGISWGINSIK